jgi:GAF domain-containing protein
MCSFEQLQGLLDITTPGPANICAAIAKIFGVKSTDVGLLTVEGDFLKFLFPVELQSVGAIPLTSSAVAARSATEKQAALFNRFAQVPHHTVFEKITLDSSKPVAEMPDPIQKMMSAPVIAEEGTVIGVVQVCRKGMTPGIAGPDFSGADLQLLERVARRVAFAMQEFAPRAPKPPQQMLRFHGDGSKKRA